MKILMLTDSAYLPFTFETPCYWRLKGRFVRGEQTFEVYFHETEFDNSQITALLSAIVGGRSFGKTTKPYNPYEYYPDI